MPCTECRVEQVKSLACIVFAALGFRGASTDPMMQADCDTLSFCRHDAHPDNNIQCPVTCTDILLSCLWLQGSCWQGRLSFLCWQTLLGSPVFLLQFVSLSLSTFCRDNWLDPPCLLARMSDWKESGQIWQNYLHLLDASAPQLFVHISHLCKHTSCS